MDRTLNKLLIVGVVFSLLGAGGLAIPVFITHQTTDVARIGDLKIQTQENTSHVIPPMVAGSVLLLGVILMGTGLFSRRV